MKKSRLLSMIFSMIIPLNALPCTGISIYTDHHELIQARTIEWAESNLNSKLVLSPAGFAYTSWMPDSTAGMSWKAKYGFVGVSVNTDRFIGEGINEKGLSAGIFYFKGYGSLAPFDPKENHRSVTDIDFVRWILSNFETVDQLTDQLKKIRIAPIFIDKNGTPSPTGHWRIADRSGKNIIIEIIKEGEIHIYDNMGILTNSPDYPWQLTNLSNYINIQSGTTSTKKFGSYEAKAFGAGTASLGLPGDITPPSRFVRAAFYLFSAPTPKSPLEGVQEAFHILNNFDIPLGSEFAEEHKGHIPPIPSATQWTSAADLTNLTFYYKTMYDSTIKSIRIKEALKGVSTEKYLLLDEGKFSFKELKF